MVDRKKRKYPSLTEGLIPKDRDMTRSFEEEDDLL